MRCWNTFVGRVVMGLVAVVGLVGVVNPFRRRCRLNPQEAAPSVAAAQPAVWKAGTARVKITPESPLWMAGYGGRDHVAEGTTSDLWAKVLVLEDAKARRVALITLDSWRGLIARRRSVSLDGSNNSINCKPPTGRGQHVAYALWTRGRLQPAADAL